jgi:hypothetical protein
LRVGTLNVVAMRLKTPVLGKSLFSFSELLMLKTMNNYIVYVGIIYRRLAVYCILDKRGDEKEMLSRDCDGCSSLKACNKRYQKAQEWDKVYCPDGTAHLIDSASYPSAEVICFVEAIP